MEFSIFILIMPLLSFLTLGLGGAKMPHKLAGIIGTASLSIVTILAYAVAIIYFGAGRDYNATFPTVTPYDYTWLPFGGTLSIDMGIMLDPISVTFPTTQEKTLHMDITRWSTLKYNY